jgi:hypothetical protein
MSEKDGGPAFPTEPSRIKYEFNQDGRISAGLFLGKTNGLSLRDYFAAKAMQGLLATGDYHTDQSADWVATESWHIADAMLRAKENGK